MYDRLPFIRFWYELCLSFQESQQPACSRSNDTYTMNIQSTILGLYFGKLCVYRIPKLEVKLKQYFKKRVRTTKALTRLHTWTGCYALFIFCININRLSPDETCMVSCLRLQNMYLIFVGLFFVSCNPLKIDNPRYFNEQDYIKNFSLYSKVVTFTFCTLLWSMISEHRMFTS